MKSSVIRTERRIRVIPGGVRKGNRDIKNLVSEWLYVCTVGGEKKMK